MKTFFLASALLVAALLWSGWNPLAATHPEVVDDGTLRCAVRGDSVDLSWNIAFFAPINGWLISRDGEVIAELDPDAASYTDEDVPSGQHLYALVAINFTGEALFIGSCTAVVGDFGVRCRADGLRVHLEWGSVPAPSLALGGFVIRRDGEVVGQTAGDVFEFDDTVPRGGVYRYVVLAVAFPGHDFLIGACTVNVPETRFVCRVAAPEVFLDWSRVPLPLIPISFFEVVRDDEVIARTGETRYSDAPSPGEHEYEVFAVAGLDTEGNSAAGRILVGRCTIVMPGGEVPPPEELTCVDLDAAPGLTDVPDDILVGAHDVLLVWQKPIEYDRVVIARNGAVIARIPGSQFYHVDRDLPPGVYTYSVFGVVNDEISPPAECTVTLPREPLPPPTDLQCEFVGVVDPNDTDAVPDGFVALRWVNGAAYERLFVVRNGELIARLSGDADRYRDDDARVGVNKYEVFGAIGRRRSEAAECLVDVPVTTVPPPEDLICLVVSPDVATTDGVVDAEHAGNDPADADDGIVDAGAVFLRWNNPLRYDRVLVVRNNSLIATLPGDTESYFDHPPFVAGTIVYSLVGVILDRRSSPATCEVEIGPPVVPSPRDLECAVITGDTSADPLPDGAVVRLTWANPVKYSELIILRNNAELARLPGERTIFFDRNPGSGVVLYGVVGVDAGGNRSRPASCEVEIPPLVVPPVMDLTCVVVHTGAGGATAILRWANGAAYDRVLILRDGEVIETLGRNATTYQDPGLKPGVHVYGVVGVIRGVGSMPRECRVVVEGPPPRNLLFFSSGLFRDAGAAATPESVDLPGDITCMASNSQPLQGWSFGVCADPSVLVVDDATTDGTTTATLNGGAGPTFLVLNRTPGGVTMAVVIDETDPSDVLPPDSTHGLLHIRYVGGPDAEPGGSYPVRYCDTLGDPPVAVIYVVGGFETTPATSAGVVQLPKPNLLQFLRGDANGDNLVEMSDAIRIWGWLFRGSPQPPCLQAADVNGSTQVNIADGVYLLQAKFTGGPSPPAPFPGCGHAPLVIGCDEPTCPQGGP